MEMPARLLPGGSAGVKDRRALCDRQAGQFEFLEGAGGHGGNLRPMRDGIRNHAARLAKFAVSEVVLELEREQHEGHAVEFSLEVCSQSRFTGRFGIEGIPGTNADVIAQSRGEDGQIRTHAVFSLRAGFPPQPG